MTIPGMSLYTVINYEKAESIYKEIKPAPDWSSFVKGWREGRVALADEVGVSQKCEIMQYSRWRRIRAKIHYWIERRIAGWFTT